MNKNEVKQLFMPRDMIQSKARIEYIDFLKVLAAFFTVFYHFAYYKLDYGFNVAQSFYFPNISRIIMCFASCCVPIFFMVNGALLFSKKTLMEKCIQKSNKDSFFDSCMDFVRFSELVFQNAICFVHNISFFSILARKENKAILYNYFSASCIPIRI